MKIAIYPHQFDPWQELQDYQNEQSSLHGHFGATNIFVGTMRDFNDGDHVCSLTLEYYPGMTEKYLKNIVSSAEQQWQILNSLIIHRVGEITPNEAIVLVAIWSTHRGDAFDACRYIMENLKSKAPFWKKERINNDSERWVEGNSNGYTN